MRSISLKEDERLSGVDNNDATWDRLTQAALGEDGLIDHIAKGEAAPIVGIEDNYPLSDITLATEESKLREAISQLGKDRAAAFSAPVLTLRVKAFMV